jgi:fructokinase
MRLGIDLGGTKIEAVVLDEAGVERFRRRTATPQGDYAGTLRAIADLVAAAERAVGARCSIGVGTPGALSPFTGLIKNANSQALNGQPLDRDLAEALGRPVRLANDADCFALSEATDGAGAGAPIVFGVIIGTGVGGGIVVNGRLLQGPNAIAGEWGHNPLPWQVSGDAPVPACWCGKQGCIETYLSGPGMAADHARRSGEQVAPRDLVRAAEQGRAAAAESLSRYEDRLARALAAVINVLDPHVIVLGGGMSNLERLYRNVPPLLSRYVFSDQVKTRLVPPRRGDSSGGRGAAWLW